MPPKEKPGACPKELDFPPCKPSVKNNCEVDSDCKETLKCCKYQCKKQCVPPLGAKTNPCPPNTVSKCLDKKYNDECGNDNQCPGTDRCC
ncbi:hypothetical protein GDO78_019955, partial [Eleutherodactylus coqui]